MNEHLENLKEIRSLMERSSKFLSLSGLSGISAGIVALVGAYLVYWKKVQLTGDTSPLGIFQPLMDENRGEFMSFIFIDALITLFIAIVFGVGFTTRKARKQGQSVWNELSKKLIISLLLPLIAGGIFCIGMVYHHLTWIVPATTLVFYGLALLNAAKYTVRDIQFLGISELILGLIAVFFTGFSLIFWALGFGILHIVYGTVMYFKYDK